VKRTHRLTLSVLLLGLLGVPGGFGRASQAGLLALASAQAQQPQNVQGSPPKAKPLPLCPATIVPTPQASQPSTGHHRVILSWNASSPGKDPKDGVVGYCLYRSKKKNVAKRQPLCPECERITQVPLADTSCFDDLVEDGVKYYYVVTAINREGRISSPSNEAEAHISDKKKDLTDSQSLPAACRGTPDRGQATASTR